MDRNYFIIGFVVGLVLFVGANVYSYHDAVPPCCDMYASFGFPLRLGTFGGFVGHTGFLLSGLIGDAFIGLGASAVFGWIVSKLLPAILSSAAQLTSWHTRTRL
jgi:hypothetical protein